MAQWVSVPPTDDAISGCVDNLYNGGEKRRVWWGWLVGGSSILNALGGSPIEKGS